MLELKAGHLQFQSKLITDAFGIEEQVNMVYYPDRKKLLIAARSKLFFEKMHKTNWSALKLKNLQGDKSLFVRNLLIDHELDETDRMVDYTLKKTGIIEISL